MEIQKLEQDRSLNLQETTRNDVVDCLAVIESTYPTFKVADVELTVNVWYNKLKEYDVRTVKNAVLELIGSNKFAPSLFDILEKCKNNKLAIEETGNYMTDEERNKMIEEIQLMIKEKK